MAARRRSAGTRTTAKRTAAKRGSAAASDQNTTATEIPRISPVAAQRPEDDTTDRPPAERRAANPLDKHPLLPQYTQAQYDALEAMRVPHHGLRVAPASAVNKVLNPDGTLSSGGLDEFKAQAKQRATDALNAASASLGQSDDDFDAAVDAAQEAGQPRPLSAAQLLTNAQTLARRANEIAQHEQQEMFLFIPTTDGDLVYFACDVDHHPDRDAWSPPESEA